MTMSVLLTDSFFSVSNHQHGPLYLIGLRSLILSYYCGNPVSFSLDQKIIQLKVLRQNCLLFEIISVIN